MEKLIKKLKELVENGFHGSVTIHFTSGAPRKIEVKETSEL